MKFKKTSLFWIYIVLGIMVLILSLMFAPIWSGCGEWAFFKNWGEDLLNVIIAIFLITYILLFLVKKLKNQTKTVILVLTLTELVLISLIALGLILSQFRIINIGGACKTLGFVLWIRGTVEVFNAYFYKGSEKTKYPLYMVPISILLITFGTYCFVKPFIKDIVILWLFVMILLILSILLIGLGFYVKPVRIKKEKKAKKQKDTKKQSK